MQSIKDILIQIKSKNETEDKIISNINIASFKNKKERENYINIFENSNGNTSYDLDNIAFDSIIFFCVIYNNNKFEDYAINGLEKGLIPSHYCLITVNFKTKHSSKLISIDLK